jgi:ribonuclease III
MSHKRKFEGQLPLAKKHRLHNGHQSNSSQTKPTIPSIPTIPDLPPISPENEILVFTHQSAIEGDTTTDTKSYERLEFLGDAYIEVIASRLLWNQFPDLPTGRLSRIRETLVKNETLAQFSVMYGFVDRLKFSGSSSNTPGWWTKVKGDIFEAYVAAVILSDPKGFEMAEDWLTKLWLPILKTVETTSTNLKAKEELAKMILAKGVKINYVDERPMVHDRKGGIETYFVGAYLTGWGWTNQHLGSGKGQNKIIAGNEAASKAMENRPLIDEIVEKRRLFFEKKKEEEKGS